MFKIGLVKVWIQHALEDLNHPQVAARDLEKALAALREAQRVIAAWSGYPYARRE